MKYQALILSLLALSACKAPEVEVTSAAPNAGSVPTTECTSSGIGSPSDPFIVCDAQSLQDIQYTPNKAYKLGADIDLAGFAWTPYSIASGSIDGDGHTISNLTYNTNFPGGGQAGMFASIFNSTIENLVLDNFQITAGNPNLAGALVQNLPGTGTVRNITITNSTITGGQRVGSVIGESCGILEDVRSDATVIADQQSGGIVGWLCQTNGSQPAILRNTVFTGSRTCTGIYCGHTVGRDYGGTMSNNN